MKIIESFKQYNCYIEHKYENIDNISLDLTKIIKDYDQYLKMCKESRKIFEEQYTWQEAKNTMIELIKK